MTSQCLENRAAAADFFPTLRTLLGHRVYLIYLCVTIIQLNSLIGMVTYKPKYIEQHFRQSASKANFLMGTFASSVAVTVTSSAKSPPRPTIGSM